jgi:hypothetical protein
MSLERSTALAPLQSTPQAVSFRNLDDIERFAELVYKSSLVPKDFRNNKADVVGVIAFGLELGLNPMAALQNISWINGRPSVYGDMMLAMVEAKGLLEAFEEIDPEEAQRTGIARCTLKRRGKAPMTRTYTQAMAEKAKLWTKDTWAAHPGRMLMMRARGWALRDAFADVLKGLYTVEEARDIELRQDASGTWQAVSVESPAPGVSGTATDAPGSPAADTPATAPEVVESRPPSSSGSADADAAAAAASSSPGDEEVRTFLREQINRTLLAVHPGNEPAAKVGRSTLLKQAFGVKTRSALASSSVAQMQAGYAHLQELVEALTDAGDEDEEPSATEGDGGSPDAPADGLATLAHLATLRTLARGLGPDAEADLQDSLDHHPGGLPYGVYRTIKARLEFRQLGRPAAAEGTP